MAGNLVAPVVIVFPKAGGVYEADLSMSGSAEPGGEIYTKKVPSDGVVDLSQVDSHGKWSLWVPPGKHTVVVGQKVNGQFHGYGDEFSFTVLPALPDVPIITSPHANASVGAYPTFYAKVHFNSGTTEVEVAVGLEGGDVKFAVGLTPWGTDGVWGGQLKESLDLGYYFVKARRTAGGIKSRWTEDVPFRVGMP